MKKRLRTNPPPPPQADSGSGWFSLERILATAAITVVAAAIAYRTGAQFEGGEVAFVFAVTYGLIGLGGTLVRRIRKPRS